MPGFCFALLLRAVLLKGKTVHSYSAATGLGWMCSLWAGSVKLVNISPPTLGLFLLFILPSVVDRMLEVHPLGSFPVHGTSVLATVPVQQGS